MPAEATYTYSKDPATDDKDAVRSLIADTNRDGKGWELSDQEILWAIAEEGSPLLAGARCCEMIAGFYTGPKRNVTRKRVGDLDIQSGARGGASEDWYALAKALRRRASRGAMPIAGGVEVSDREDRTDTSLLQPDFVRGMDDFTTDTARVLPDVT